MSLPFVVTTLLLLSASTAHPWGKLSAEDEFEMEKKLKIINKPAKISFKTEFGDTIDCVDIYKQPAFDHPLLKDHKIRMQPKGTPETGTSLPIQLKTQPCPKGTVPIIRATKEDLLMANYLPRDNSIFSAQSMNGNDHPKGYAYAVTVHDKGPVYGASGNVNTWFPSVPAGQMSTGTIEVANGLDGDSANSVEAGWMVYDFLYKNYTRIYTYWTNDGFKHGCYNLLCPGFVQASSQVPVGTVARPVSVYNGAQYELQLKIYQDNTTGDWWLRLHNEAIGYWPKTLFTSMQKGASHVAWGGVVYSPDANPSAPMGSGHFPLEGLGKAAFVGQMKLANPNEVFSDVVEADLRLFSNQPNCYDAVTGSQHDLGKYVFYGGPGGCNLQ